jgi:hypothetical protein
MMTKKILRELDEKREKERLKRVVRVRRVAIKDEERISI